MVVLKAAGLWRTDPADIGHKQTVKTAISVINAGNYRIAAFLVGNARKRLSR
jgi:hypothetical protein